MRVRLAIETSNPSAREGGVPGAGVAIGALEDGGAAARLIDRESVDTRPGADDDLLPAIARLFARHGLSARELDSIAISAGPGGYTALRIAMATAKMLSLATGATCIPVPSARVAWFAMKSGMDGMDGVAGGRLAVALSSKDQTSFVTVFDGAGTPVEAGRLMDAEAIAGLDAAALAADRFLPEAMRAAAEARGLEIRPLVLEADACLAASTGLAAVAAEALLPMYPREPEAVTKWRRLHSPKNGG